MEAFGGPWLAGDAFTAVDAMFAPVAVRIRGYGIELGPDAMAYAERLLAHPAVTEWVEQGVAEPWILLGDDRRRRRLRAAIAG